jgi:hypothetical protein
LRYLDVHEDTRFAPTEEPSPEGTPVEQVIVTSDWLAGAFQLMADRETMRGIPTVVRTVSWIEGRYPGADGPARIRTFLRDAYDSWGTRYVVLGGNTEHVPTRYVQWEQEQIATDLYYQCLDREWNEDGDALYGEALRAEDLNGYVNDLAVDAGGDLWVATYHGLVVYDESVVDLHDVSTGLPSDEIQAVDIAPDGTVWVATGAGIARRTGGSWTVWTTADGLPSDLGTDVVAVSAGEAWVSTFLGIAHFDGLVWTSWGMEEGIPEPLVSGIALNGSAVWMITSQGAVKLEAEQIDIFNTTNSGILSHWLLTVAVDDSGNVWFGHSDNYFAEGGLSRFDGVSWTTDDFPARGGLSIHDFEFLSGGNGFWAATGQGLLHRDTGADTLYGPENGLAGMEQYSVVDRGGGEIAVGGAEGVSMGTPGNWTILDETNGLPIGVVDYDDIDLLPELAVARIPAVDSTEVALYFQKLRDYRAGLNVDRVDHALFMGEMLFEGVDGKDFCLAAKAEFPVSFSFEELYETDGTLDAAAALAALDYGPGYVVQVAHGSYDVIGVGPGLELLFNSDLDGIDSGGRFSFYDVYSCNTGGFDQDCSMEHLLLNPNGGAIGTVSNTREAHPGADAKLSEAFFTALFASTSSEPCTVMREVIEQAVTDDPDTYRLMNGTRRALLTRSYLGAATLSLWRDAPAPLAVTHPATVPFRRADFSLTVTDSTSGQPIDGALVCLSKGIEDYAFGRTDSTGSITFDFRPESAGSVTVFVSAPEYAHYEGSAAVDAASGPNPVAEGWQLLSPPGRAFPDTDWTISLGVRNFGEASLGGWTLTLTTPHPEITIIDSSGTLDELGAGAFAWTSGFPIRLSSALPDSTEFTLSLHGTGPPGNFDEEYVLTASKPGLALDGLTVNGVTIRPRITNTGSAATGPLTGTLRSVGSGTVIDSLGAGPSADPGQTVEFTDGFDVLGELEDRFELRVIASDGTELVRDIDRESPAGVTSAMSEPLDTGARLTWDASPSPDLAGYRVLGRDNGGPWVDEFSHLVTQGGQAEVSFGRAARRDFLVLAVDSSGHESADSSFIEAYSSPETMPGWPLQLISQVGPSPIVAVDLDGDGVKEILLGSMWEANSVHVFRLDGTEWNDGDQDSGTPGIFGETDGRIHATPLAVDIDGDQQMEIFAGSFDGFVYGWRTDGPAGVPPPDLPGWPVDHNLAAVRNSPVAGDLDGDQELEIVTVCTDARVRAYETNGTLMSGWPYETGQGNLGSTPAVHDLNGDSLEDLVFGATDSTLCVVSGNGSDLPGWPVHLGAKVLCSPVLADVDGDEDMEIFVQDRNGLAWGFQHDDQDTTPGPDVLPGWPVQLAQLDVTPPSPALADLDADSVPEIVFGTSEELAILRADGTPFPGWPANVTSDVRNSPVIADIDGNGELDVIVGTGEWKLEAYHLDGTVVPGWPRRFYEAPKSTPFVGDFDGDGDLDMVLGSDDRWIRVLDLDAPALPGSAPWPGYHGSADQRGVYFPTPTLPTDVTLEIPAPLPGRFALLPAAPNPFRAATDLRFALPRQTLVRLDVYAVDGRRVATPLAGELLPAGVHTVAWNGRDRANRPVASGVYFLRLRAGSETRTGKVLRLR